jgi:hypothetical protein
MYQKDFIDRNISLLAKLIAKIVNLKYADARSTEIVALKEFSKTNLDIDVDKLLGLTLLDFSKCLDETIVSNKKHMIVLMDFILSDYLSPNIVNSFDFNQESALDKLILLKLDELSQTETYDFKIVSEIKFLIKNKYKKLPDLLDKKCIELKILR